MGQLQTHPILSKRSEVDKQLRYKKIQREFYDDIFDDKANLHALAYDYLRKQMRTKTQFNQKYCKQMTVKILFEIIHLCYKKVNRKFDEIYNTIRENLGININVRDNGPYKDDEKKYEDEDVDADADADANGESDLERALDFVLKYQYTEIFANIQNKVNKDIIEDIYETEFKLIIMHDAQNILKYDLHDPTNPTTRNQHLCEYINKLCIVCFKMVIFSHKIKN